MRKLSETSNGGFVLIREDEGKYYQILIAVLLNSNLKTSNQDSFTYKIVHLFGDLKSMHFILFLVTWDKGLLHSFKVMPLAKV